MPNHFIQAFLRDIIGDLYCETLYFHPVFLRYHGGYAGNNRVSTVVNAYEPYSGPGQTLVPAVEFDIGQLTNDQFIRLMGESHLIAFAYKKYRNVTDKLKLFFRLCIYGQHLFSSTSWISRSYPS